MLAHQRMTTLITAAALLAIMGCRLADESLGGLAP
jgi:hypothetical protein